MTEPNSNNKLRAAMELAFPAYDDRLSAFYRMAEYHLGWRDGRLWLHNAGSGKLIRPRLCLLGCRVAGGSEARMAQGNGGVRPERGAFRDGEHRRDSAGGLFSTTAAVTSGTVPGVSCSGSVWPGAGGVAANPTTR